MVLTKAFPILPLGRTINQEETVNQHPLHLGNSRSAENTVVVDESVQENPRQSISRCSHELSHTYTHNWPLQPFSQDYGLASHTTHVVCVNFIRGRRDLQFNVDSERQIF